ncbi:DUF4159 domain-containing protein [Cryomorpha ignava]|uniref:DUF4159 domain-containing protein n=1 Tax=Cryomorpha ignava TaxID=101383 RepID=A0A7K3WX48_9FLAO|nr:DUF4159 domain-containing protein [Cryomorpha ignava]NEN25215.1 DUF4159 domain-containing protein [Cryomorpha ignava]
MKHGLFFIFLLISGFAMGQNSSYSLAVLQYRGGGDWYANPTSVPNLAEFCRQELSMEIGETEFVDVGSPDLFNYPFVHMTGHGNVVWNSNDQTNLRAYLLGGGFLHIDDNYGMDAFIRPQIKQLFPDKELVEVPFDHPIYHQKYNFPNGLPKIHEHDGLPPQGFGIFDNGRLVLFYTYESDLGDGWEDESVHNDPADMRLKALQMGANIVQYAFTGEGDLEQ